ncbi:MAG: pyridoxamine kinase [Oscillospiraceae bacterium]|nr:pyridoxamine kinase [Oscillospiraceae bacterium]
MSHNHQKKAAVINDFSGFGRCSIAVSLPILSAMGMQCCPLPTAIFSNHTGFPSFSWMDYTERMTDYMLEWKKLDLRFNAIATGFLGSVRQIEIVEQFLELFCTPETIVVVDPVMGDNGSLYPTYTMEMAESIRELARHADILTPNLTEACILTGQPYRTDFSEEELAQMCQQLHQLGAKKVVITGLDKGDSFVNFVSELGQPFCVIRVGKAGASRSGTGDVFSSIITGNAVNGVGFAESVHQAASFVAAAIRRSEELGLPRTDGVAFEEVLPRLFATRNHA